LALITGVGCNDEHTPSFQLQLDSLRTFMLMVYRALSVYREPGPESHEPANRSTYMYTTSVAFDVD